MRKSNKKEITITAVFADNDDEEEQAMQEFKEWLRDVYKKYDRPIQNDCDKIDIKTESMVI